MANATPLNTVRADGAYDLSAFQYNIVYDFLSFSLATMMATTIFCWMRVSSIHGRYKSALIITGLVTFIASYHYFRIFNSWVESYEWADASGLKATGVPFNDAYRYMDWLLTVPLLLIEIVLVMKVRFCTPSTKPYCVYLFRQLKRCNLPPNV